MYEKLTEADIEFIGILHDPIGLKECLFPENLKALHFSFFENFVF